MLCLAVADRAVKGAAVTFAGAFIAESVEVIAAIDPSSIERLATGLADVRERGGRLFILGVGGSAGHASHAVNDFRKICGFEAYAPDRQRLRADRAHQRRGLGHDASSEWLKGSRLDAARRGARLLRRRRQAERRTSR